MPLLDGNSREMTGNEGSKEMQQSSLVGVGFIKQAEYLPSSQILIQLNQIQSRCDYMFFLTALTADQ